MVLQCISNAPKWHQNVVNWKELTERMILMYKKCILDALQFLMIFHFLVLQCTTNGANLPFNLLVSNLHALGSILNPILTTFKWLDFWLILADFALTVLKYSTKPRESVIIFEFSIVELVCMRSFSTSFCGANEISCAARCGGGWAGFRRSHAYDRRSFSEIA